MYQDRFLKDLEMKFEVFDISDVKSYRVKQIKRLNTIVWDRENKFEDLSLWIKFNFISLMFIF